MDYSSLDDETLIGYILQAKPEALASLYDRYSRLVFSIALHTVGRYETAEEITQDVFLRVWNKAYTYQPDQAKVVTWISSITRYRSIDMLRKRGARPQNDSLSLDELQSGSIPASNSDLEDLASLSIEQRRVHIAVAALPQEQRQALDLAYFQGLTHSEIAARLDQPLGTVKTRIRLGMQKLRELLREDTPENS